MPQPFYISSNTLMVNETGPLLQGTLAEPRSFGISFHRGTVPILPQAVGGIISQALYKAYLELGDRTSVETHNFQHTYSEADFARVCFDVDVAIVANEVEPGIYMMTNRRIATVLSLMGFDFSEQDNLTNLREYTFDVIVSNPHNTTTIGKGILRNSYPLTRPYRVGDPLAACQRRSGGASS
ncbi:MAG: hypothetical protein Q9168_003715 [Polycauliona sp. 1 TL-2023]